MLNTSTPTARLTAGAVIAAVYALLSLALAPISYGPVQVRAAEMLCILPAFTAAAVPGLFVGCLIANALGVALGLTMAVDIVFGSLATLIAAALGYLLRRHRWLVPLPAVVVNAVVIGVELCYFIGVEAPLWSCMLYVALGQIVSCYALGMPLMLFMSKTFKKLHA